MQLLIEIPWTFKAIHFEFKTYRMHANFEKSVGWKLLNKSDMKKKFYYVNKTSTVDRER